MSTDNNIESGNEPEIKSSLDLPEYVEKFLRDRKRRADELSNILTLLEGDGADNSPAIECASRLAQDLAESLDSAYMVCLAQGQPLRDVLRDVRMTALGE